MVPPVSRSKSQRAAEFVRGLFVRSSQPPKLYVTRWGTLLTAVLMLGWGALVITNITGAWPRSPTPATVDVRVVDTLGQVTLSEIDSLQARVASAALAAVREFAATGDTIRVYAVVRRIDIVGVSWDYRLLLISVWFGALGSLLHAGSSFGSFAGNRQLVASWVPWYIVRPLLGAGLATVFYVVMRAGLATTAGVPLANVSHFTVAAAAALVGLFTQRATLKLREVFDALFPPQEGDQHADALGGDESVGPPRIASLNPATVRAGTDAVPIEIVADYASADATLIVGGEATEFVLLPTGNLSFVLEADLIATTGKVEVVLKSKAGTSEPARLIVTA